MNEIGPYFDCDSHIVESLENLTRHQSKAFKEKYRLERRETADGKYPWYLNGRRLEILEDATRPGNLIPKPGALKEFLRALKEGRTEHVFVPAGPEVLTREGRLQHMDATGVEASILYPGEVISMWPYFSATEDRGALLHSFNEYLVEDWGFNYRDRPSIRWMSEVSEASLLFDTPAAGVCRVTFNRPKTYNAFTFDMFRTLLEWLRTVQYDVDTRVVVLTGAGLGFCSGLDLVDVAPPPWVAAGVGPQHRDLYAMQEIRELPLTLRGLPQPVIAAVNGPVAGIGTEGGVSYLLPRAVGSQRAAELLLTGRAVDADEAADIGLVLEAVPDDRLMPRVLELAEAMTTNTPLDNWLTKQALHANLEAQSYARALDLETRGVILSRTTADATERRAADQERRPPNYKHQ